MKRILVIEDEPLVAESIRFALETEGFHCSWSPTGRGGIRLLAEEPVDLVILDVGLPDGSGFDLCREIRRDSNVPVIFLTARSEEIDRVVGLEIGADDYVVKPFSPRELTARVRAVLRRGGPDRSETAPSDGSAGSPFRVDPQRRIIEYFQQSLSLTRFEYELLRLLVEQPGRVYTREQLMEAIWPDPLASFDRTVDAHVKNLRAKLRRVREDVVAIRTHRGVGYSLRERW